MAIVKYSRELPIDENGAVVTGASEEGSLNGATETTLVEVRDRLPSVLVGDRLKVDVASLSVTVSNAQLEIANDAGNPIPVSGNVSISGAIDTRYTAQFGSTYSGTGFGAIVEGRVVDPTTPPTYIAGGTQAPSLDLNGVLLTNARSLTAARDAVTVNAKKGTFSDRSGTVTTGGTAQQLAAANTNRTYLLVQNNSTADLWINFGVTAVANQPSIRLSAGAIYILESSAVSTELVSIIGATTGQAFTAKEMS